ncbi:MAG: cadherin-like beta sandwich domain-containing protein [Lachnospiraceae bacterium]|nr:cadherin-like beta sandwich domain-containing protein [Lachnospiraceae bacterium]
MKKTKFFSMILCLILSLSLFAASSGISSLAAGYDTDGMITDPAEDNSSVLVYFTLSDDGVFVTGEDSNHSVLARMPLTVSWFDLTPYGLDNFTKYDDDTGEVLKKPTLLHAIIRALETYYCPDNTPLQIGSDALTISGNFSSMYMQQFWGHDENLMYYVNHAYPLMYEGWGATADWIELQNGFELDFAMFSDWSFYTSGAFAYFDKTYSAIKPQESITLNMYASSTNMWEPDCDASVSMANELVQMSTDNGYSWTDVGTTDAEGSFTFTPDHTGVYYFSSGQNGESYHTFHSDSGSACVAPPIAIVIVNEKGEAPTRYPVHFQVNAGDSAVTSASVTVRNADQETMTSEGGYYYLENGTYTYQVSADGYETAGGAFTVNGTSQTITVELSEQALMQGLELSDRNRNIIYLNDFDPAVREYTVTVPDTVSGVYVTATQNSSAPTGTTLTGTFAGAATTGNPGSNQNVTFTSGSMRYISGLISAGSYGNTLTVTAKYGNISQSYTVHIVRDRSLSSLTLASGGSPLVLTPAFSVENYQYEANILNTDTSVTVKAASYRAESYHYSLDVNGISVTSGEEAEIPLDKDTDALDITVSHADGSSNTYHIALNRKKSVTVQFELNPQPQNPVILLTDGSGNTIDSDEDGCYHLMEDAQYSYKITAKGYLCKTGIFTARDMTLPIELTEEVPSDDTWSNFRGNDANNAVTSAPVPVNADEATLYWATKYGNGWSSGAPSSAIIVNGYLYFTSNKSIVKMDTVTGEIVASGDMKTTSAFNITPPTYAEGIIFVALANGIVQAFDAETLESLWFYQDALGGQPNSPITYHNGYVYTGFWNSEIKDANYVCLSIEDEDPSDTLEQKDNIWTYTQTGGFYWAGCYVCDEYLLVGTDDGQSGYTSQTSNLLSINPTTGQLISSVEGLNADIRSSISYDEETRAFYFTTKGGSFYQVRVDSNGMIQEDSLREIHLDGMSTSTPVVHNGRAYIGVAGTSQFAQYSGHNITVIDLDRFEIAYTCPTQGYPQTSGLLTTAYEAQTGYVYVYFIDNYTPGKIRVIRDCPGQTIMNEDESLSYAPVLFTPSGAQAQYAICSPIADEYGTLYFKNDSAHMMALGSRITSIEMTQAPDQTIYKEGELFLPAGMKVVAHYANGCTRDITNYVSYSARALTTEDEDITISFDHVLYQDTDDNDNSNDWNNVNVVVDAPFLTLDIQVLSTSDAEKLEDLTSLVKTIDVVQELLVSTETTDASSSLTLSMAINSVTEFLEKYDMLSENGKDQVTQDMLNSVNRLKNTISQKIKHDQDSDIIISDMDAEYWNIGISVTTIVKDSLTYDTIPVDCGDNQILSLYHVMLVNYATGESFEPQDGTYIMVSLPALSYDTSRYQGIMIIHQPRGRELEYITPTIQDNGRMSFSLDSFSPIGVVGIPKTSAPSQGSDSTGNNNFTGSTEITQDNTTLQDNSSLQGGTSQNSAPPQQNGTNLLAANQNIPADDSSDDSMDQPSYEDSDSQISADAPVLYSNPSSLGTIAAITAGVLLLIAAITLIWYVREKHRPREKK